MNILLKKIILDGNILPNKFVAYAPQVVAYDAQQNPIYQWVRCSFCDNSQNNAISINEFGGVTMILTDMPIQFLWNDAFNEVDNVPFESLESLQNYLQFIPSN